MTTEDKKVPARSRTDGVISALRAIDNREEQSTEVDEEALTAAVADAVDTPPPATAEGMVEAMTAEVDEPVRFSAHSQARIEKLQREEADIADQARELRRRINELEDEYTDLMLSASGISADIAAIEHNRVLSRKE